MIDYVRVFEVYMFLRRKVISRYIHQGNVPTYQYSSPSFHLRSLEHMSLPPRIRSPEGVLFDSQTLDLVSSFVSAGAQAILEAVGQSKSLRLYTRALLTDLRASCLKKQCHDIFVNVKVMKKLFYVGSLEPTRRASLAAS